MDRLKNNKSCAFSTAVARRDEAIERFDNGAVLEHIALPLVLFTGLLMVWEIFESQHAAGYCVYPGAFLPGRYQAGLSVKSD